MEIVNGTVVKVIAGREKNNFFVILGLTNDERYVIISDGRIRRLEAPKKKNIKHLRFTNTVINIDGITNKQLKIALRDFCFSGDEREV